MRQGADRGKFEDRKFDLYETPECATRALIRTGVLDEYDCLFEPCAGRGAISRVLKAEGFKVLALDLIDYPGRDEDIYPCVDFFKAIRTFEVQAIVTNPPFKDSDKFVRKALSLGLPTFVLLRLMALEGARRSDIMAHLRHVFIGIERLPMMHRDGWSGKRLKAGAMPFGWFCFSPEPNTQGVFSASRISWREPERDDELNLHAIRAFKRLVHAAPEVG